MLKYVDHSDLSELLGYLKGDPYRAKCAGLLSAYGVGSLVEAWADRGDGQLHTLALRFGSALTLCCTEQTDIPELRDFLAVTGCEKVFAQGEYIKKLCLPKARLGSVMRFSGIREEAPPAFDGSQRLREVYKLISDSIPNSFSPDGYLYWLSDITYRERRGLSRVRCVLSGDTLAACALTSAESATDAIISGVASLGSLRGQGYGKQVVLSLAQELSKENKQVFVFVLNEGARNFYLHIGFEDIGQWGEAESL